MVNTEKFASRLNRILEFYDLSAASFADKIEVGRSSISHILSGRNKPSLDFVMKIVKNFPEVELYWLLNGKGNFPAKTSSGKAEVQELPAGPNSPSISEKKAVPDKNEQISQLVPSSKSDRQIQKIVIFYSDGSFEAFEN